VEGGGNPNRMFNADWSHVDWPSVGSMLLVTAVGRTRARAGGLYLLLPRAVKRIGAAFVALAVVAPLGLIAPGFAYGEGSTADVKAAFGYVPGGLQRPVGRICGADVRLQPAAAVLRRRQRAALARRHRLRDRRHRSASWLSGESRTWSLGYCAAATGSPTRRRRPARDRRRGWPRVLGRAHRLAGADPRRHNRQHRARRLHRTTRPVGRMAPAARSARKARRLPVAIVAASLASSVVGLALLYAATLAARTSEPCPVRVLRQARLARDPVLRRIVVVPAIFFVPGDRVFDLALGPAHLAPSWNGLAGAVLFVSRVGVSVSLAVLLVVTTPWADVLKSLRALRTPQVFVLVLSMTYRYIFLFLHTQRDTPGAQEPRGGPDARRRAAPLDHRHHGQPDEPRLQDEQRRLRGHARPRLHGRSQGLQHLPNAAADWLALAGTAAFGAAAVLASRVVA
jgi:hypothetical protein